MKSVMLSWNDSMAARRPISQIARHSLGNFGMVWSEGDCSM
jgi:hypothetical protein